MGRFCEFIFAAFGEALVAPPVVDALGACSRAGEVMPVLAAVAAACVSQADAHVKCAWARPQLLLFTQNCRLQA